MTTEYNTIPLQNVTHENTTGQTPSDHHGLAVSVDNEIARYNGILGALQSYTSGGPTISDTGVLLLPAQPAFSATGGVQSNVTGNAAAYPVLFATEIFDQGGNFASNTFTAPVTGRYLLTANVSFDGVTSAATYASLRIITSNRTYSINIDVGPDSINGLSNSVVADLDASDTALVHLVGFGEAGDVWDIRATPECEFSGYLLG